MQRHVLYLGEINASQERVWCKSIEVFEDPSKTPRTLALFPEALKGSYRTRRWCGSG